MGGEIIYLHVMNIRTLYSCLQRDILSKYGREPQLSIDSIPLYEAFYRDLLVLIEWIGTKSHDSLVISSSSELPLIAGVKKLTISYVSGNVDHKIDVPLELVDLFEVFIQSGHPDWLRCLRQICLFTYKSKSHVVTPDQESLAIAGFRSRNARCQTFSASFFRQKSQEVTEDGKVLQVSRLLFNMVLDRCDWTNIVPSHGPGAIADGKRGIGKWRAIDSCCTRLCDKFYPISEWFVPTPDLFDYKSARYSNGACKLAIVPKDKRGPRVICTQPSGLMWIQKGQQRLVEGVIESSPLLRSRRLYRGTTIGSSIKFDNQEQNGSLALESSRTREFSTIDLKDASDLVSAGLVRFLCNKRNAQYLFCSRSSHVKIADELVKLHMFAPMGSAMCFPVESLVFWCIATAATLVLGGVTYKFLQQTRSPYKWLTNNLSEVFVFGDDMLVRREVTSYVCERLMGVGFIPNTRKTFCEGFYRESCGVDAYRGERLDIARLQRPSLTSMSDAYATIDLSNRLRSYGMINTAEWLEIQINSFLGFNLAVGNYGQSLYRRSWPDGANASSLALSHNIRFNCRIRFNTRYQRWDAMSVIVRPRVDTRAQDDRCRLFRGLTTGVSEHTVDWLSPDNSLYYLGWIAAF